MRLSTLFFVVLSLCLLALTTKAASDFRKRFEGLVGKNVQAAWTKIDKEGSFLLSFSKLEVIYCIFNSTWYTNRNHARKFSSIEESNYSRLRTRHT
jgi:hypothetical protein